MTNAPASRTWRCGAFRLSLDHTLVMGIVNVTPDSFSDGGRFADPLVAVEHARGLADVGADVIDVGGESTRPGSGAVPPRAELARVLSVITALVHCLDIPVSIDTRHAEVASACVREGASIVNDISGFRDPAMVALAARCEAGLVVMHMLGEPKTMQDEPVYTDVVAEVRDYLSKRAAELESAGVARDRIALDPGIGFGKTTAHNLELLRRLPEIAVLGYPVLVGASRKRFIGELTGEVRPDRRLAGSVAAAVWSAHHGADIVRVHDVADTVQALVVAHAIEGASDD
ncbi:MAG: dihydropteroate synthase [Coriobacteriia bacterium]|nr:dihydropteroate synthase [Coriobacteriia bacterium]